ncbi:MAG: hypothetical protein K6G17_07445 [Oscillospiraceae bacterium]|nr:hypothetical protein [Oscillospiraceae bacterium]
METVLVTAENVVLLLAAEERIEPCAAIRSCLLEHGLDPWERAEAESFELGDGRLLLARPFGPRRQRLEGGVPRLRRADRS